MSRRGWAALALFAASSLGCEKSTCRAGEQVACVCPGGASGAQRCNRAGSQFEECDCSGPSPSATAISGRLADLEESDARTKSKLSTLEARVAELERSSRTPPGPTAGPPPAAAGSATVDDYVREFCACRGETKCIADAGIRYQEVIVKTPFTAEQGKKLADCSRPSTCRCKPSDPLCDCL